MVNRIIHSCAHGVLGLDIADGACSEPTAVPEPSQELLDRALVGWERFIGIAEEPHDD
ncbi:MULTISPECIES: hypothetical protein [unclassified Streptomyces]|uniref:hypothetical protein n=1 Tax=unclassified Streptomyces TaxID=2593676 RepID=UPI000B32CEC8|nr:hypothetical protein [Streptomyces sp. PCS3-D2]WKV72589.1 hypothetical protein AW27_014295 [Streptomyces sp. PCS3-D2]